MSTTIHDYEYLYTMQQILNRGEKKDNRTGVPTIGTFGEKMQFDLQFGFPLLTSKKVHFPSIVWELLWFIRGETNVKWLQDKGVTIWDEWSDANGNLGPVYGSAWRNFGGKPRVICQPEPKLPEGIEATYLGVANGSDSYKHPLLKVWQGMIQRCYSKDDIGYEYYGQRGVYVCNRWLEFNNFATDAVKLPGWQDVPGLQLDKDTVGDGFVYSPETCQWVTPSENQLAKSNKIYVVEKDGQQYTFSNPTTFCRQHGIDDRNFSDLWSSKNAKIRYGYSLVEVIDTTKGIDQLQDVINRIKTNPNDRRLLVSAWDVRNLKYMALPPCHLLFQFYVRNKRFLDCQLYQRSCDFFLGVPFNIASYALLMHIVAHLTNLDPGIFKWIGGDCHVYENHLEQVKEQLSRPYRPSPTLRIRENAPTDIDADWGFEHFELLDYIPHPPIRAKVAV